MVLILVVQWTKGTFFFQDDRFCLKNDVKTILGGEMYTLDNVVFHIDQVIGTLQVAGKVTNSDTAEETAFWYVVNPITCSLYSYIEFSSDEVKDILSVSQGVSYYIAFS